MHGNRDIVLRRVLRRPARLADTADDGRVGLRDIESSRPDPLAECR